MTATQIAARKSLYKRLRNLSDYDARQVLDFIDTLEEHEPNEETIKAIEDSYKPENLIECDDIDDMFEKCGVKTCA